MQDEMKAWKKIQLKNETEEFFLISLRGFIVPVALTEIVGDVFANGM